MTVLSRFYHDWTPVVFFMDWTEWFSKKILDCKRAFLGLIGSGASNAYEKKKKEVDRYWILVFLGRLDYHKNLLDGYFRTWIGLILYQSTSATKLR